MTTWFKTMRRPARLMPAIMAAGLVLSACAAPQPRPQVVEESYSVGYLRATVNRPISMTQEAVEKGYLALGIAIRAERGDQLTGIVEGQLADQRSVTTGLRSIDPNRTGVSIRIGALGDKALSARILQSIKKNLNR